MNAALRTCLVVTAFVVLSDVRPGLAGDSTPPAPAGMEWWRLRTTDVLTTGATTPSAPRKPPASDIPEARRTVRVVYPGLLDNR